jgi:hypothetical protein
MFTNTFPFVQPEMFYIVLKQVTWTANERFFDGNVISSVFLQQRFGGISPQIEMYGGVMLGNCIDLILNTYGVVRMLFNGVNSSLQVNQSPVIAGNAGLNNSNGLTLGSRTGGLSFCNIEVKEIILRRIADTAANQLLIYNYLKRVNGI